MKSLRIKGITKNKPMTMTPIKIGSSLEGRSGGGDDVVTEGVDVEGT